MNENVPVYREQDLIPQNYRNYYTQTWMPLFFSIKQYM